MQVILFSNLMGHQQEHLVSNKLAKVKKKECLTTHGLRSTSDFGILLPKIAFAQYVYWSFWKNNENSKEEQ